MEAITQKRVYAIAGRATLFGLRAPKSRRVRWFTIAHDGIVIRRFSTIDSMQTNGAQR